jgi:hypothetical protein
MKEIKKLTVELLEDRGFRKVRVNLVENGSIRGWLKAI